ncbi:MAG TPA: hypothetical protein VF269_02935 [Rhodanobacteraceae bacterium]
MNVVSQDPAVAMPPRPENPLRQRSLWIAVVLWVMGSLVVFPLSDGHLPFDWPQLAHASMPLKVLMPQGTVIAFIVLIGIVYWLTRRRAIPDMSARSPSASTAKRELLVLWIYIGIVMAVGQIVGRKLFGEGIAMHLNGALFGATRVQPPPEVWTWAIFNFVLLAAAPYAVFRLRGFSHEALNLRSTNLRNDTLVIVVVLVLNSLPVYFQHVGIFAVSVRQAIIGGGLSFIINLLGTCLPVMVLVYAIMMPRYAKLTHSKTTLWLLAAVSYPTLHLLEYWTVYNSVTNGLLSVIFVYLTLFPAGMVKSFLTLRTGNAWVHVWAFHAIYPHVIVGTPLIVKDFGIHT